MAKKQSGFRTVGVSGSSKTKAPKNTRTKGQAVDVKAALRGFNTQLSKVSGIATHDPQQ